MQECNSYGIAKVKCATSSKSEQMFMKLFSFNIMLSNSTRCNRELLYTYYIIIDVTFIPFGPENGDNETVLMDGSFTLLGPLTLDTPLVFYLLHQHQLYVNMMKWFVNILHKHFRVLIIVKYCIAIYPRHSQ